MKQYLSINIGESDDGVQGYAETEINPDMPDGETAYFRILGQGIMYMMLHNQSFLIQIGAQAMKKMEKEKSDTLQEMETLVDTPSQGRA